MKKVNLKQAGRLKRKTRIRKKIVGTTTHPRLSVFKSAKHLYAQIIDDTEGKTLVSCSTMDKNLKGKVKTNLEGAKEIGKHLAKTALKKGIQAVVFDRNGFRYHGQLKALAEGAREEGIKF